MISNKEVVCLLHWKIFKIYPKREFVNIFRIDIYKFPNTIFDKQFFFFLSFIIDVMYTCYVDNISMVQ